MARAAALAAGLLSLTLVAACSQDEPTRTTALPSADPSASATASASASAAPSASAAAVRTEMGSEPSDDATPPTAVATRAAPTMAPAAAPPKAAAPAPAPKASTKTSEPSSPKPAPRPTATATKTASPTPKPAQPSQFALTIRDFTFSPRVLTIPVGSTVTATNQDEATHDWTSRDSVWRSGDLAQGESFSFRFPRSGTFDYLCERHPQMTGSITVTPS